MHMRLIPGPFVHCSSHVDSLSSFAMVTHYVTLKALQLEFDPRLRGSAVAEIFSQQKNELVVSFARTGGAAEESVVISTDPKLNYIVVRERVARARKNSVDLFPLLDGARLREVTMHPSDRTMYWIFDGGLTLCAQLYNTIRSNILLVDADQRIQGAFKDAKSLEGTIAGSDRTRPVAPEAGTTELSRRLRAEASRTLLQSLKQAAPQLGTLFAREILARADADPDLAAGEAGDAMISAVAAEYEALLSSLSRPSPVLYLSDDSTAAFSPVALRSMGGKETVEYPDTNAGVRDVLRRSFRTKGSADHSKELLGKIAAERDRAERRRDAVARELRESERSVEYERFGSLLLAHLAEVRKGMRHVDVVDFDGVAEVRIELDPTLAPASNAERYFSKAKKAKGARGESLQRMPELERRLAALQSLAEDLGQRQSIDEQKEFMEEHEDELRGMKLVAPAKGKELPPFRIFAVEGGYEVWVGKSSANNDLLTMKYAKPHDLWFHVRGASGSHTVLKTKGGDPTPRTAIQQAASIAAYYSKMRNAGNVPVAYCERKYVRKPKGSAQGAVVLEREKTILVKPGLP